ncbi:MAG: hypothetical protein ABW046_06735 [Actinoplanes sp.]
MRTELHIGIDAEKIVVSPYPIKLRAGRATRRRSGSVTEMLPVPPTGADRDARLTLLARLSLPLFVLSGVFYAAGTPWWLPLTASATLLTAVWRRQARAAQPANFAPPTDASILRSPEERIAYDRAVVVSRRVRATWPGLSGMIDPAEADVALTRALQDLAEVMARRQDLRRLRAELSAVRRKDVPADSPALLALDAQRETADRLWLETADQANRILRGIDRAARTGETFLREQAIGATARQAELVLAGLTEGAPPAETAPDLADRTTAVIDAYRDLSAPTAE